MLTAAKGIANGLPLGATLCADWIADADPEHGSTFSGGPVVCAAANATLDTVVEEDVPNNAARVGEHLKAGIETATEEHDLPVREVRGLGLMIGVEVKRGSNRLLRDLALNEQVLALPAGRTVLRLLPPLTIEETHADRLIDALVEVTT
jgi:acetylornithine/LysW-gamma-L-lysine aminotransferase